MTRRPHHAPGGGQTTAGTARVVGHTWLAAAFSPLPARAAEASLRTDRTTAGAFANGKVRGPGTTGSPPEPQPGPAPRGSTMGSRKARSPWSGPRPPRAVEHHRPRIDRPGSRVRRLGACRRRTRPELKRAIVRLAEDHTRAGQLTPRAGPGNVEVLPAVAAGRYELGVRQARRGLDHLAGGRPRAECPGSAGPGGGARLFPRRTMLPATG